MNNFTHKQSTVNRLRTKAPTFRTASKLIGWTLPLFALCACQSTPDVSPVMQRANQTYETTGVSHSKINAKKQALSDAKQTCGKLNPIILQDDMVYNGVLDEQTGKMVKTTNKVLKSVIGVDMLNVSSEDDYEFTINFRCE